MQCSIAVRLKFSHLVSRAFHFLSQNLKSKRNYISFFILCQTKGVNFMVMIEKMNGQMEAFIPEKVIVSAIKSGAPLNIARDIAEQISGDIHDGMTTQDIKVQLLLLL